MRLYREKCIRITLIDLLLFIVVLLGWTTLVFAHGGGLDQSGGHNCYVGSCRGSYHYHKGSSSNFDFSWLFWLAIIGVGVFYYVNSKIKNTSNESDQSDQVLKDFPTDHKVPDNYKLEQIKEEEETELFVSLDWLSNRIDFDSLEKEFEDFDNLSEELQEDWVTLKHMYRDGDEVWEFESPADYWESLCGSAGFALIRQGKIIFTIETTCN